MTSTEKLRWIYSQELHASISWVWDGGFDWVLGWPEDQVVAYGNSEHLELAIEDLYRAAKEHLKT